MWTNPKRVRDITRPPHDRDTHNDDDRVAYFQTNVPPEDFTLAIAARCRSRGCLRCLDVSSVFVASTAASLPAMDPLRPLRASSATAAMSEHAVANATANMIAGQQRNGMHRAINVHGRLMYDEIVINDVWINAVLSTLALSCAACVCLCFLYCKFQQWKHAGKTVMFCTVVGVLFFLHVLPLVLGHCWQKRPTLVTKPFSEIRSVMMSFIIFLRNSKKKEKK